MKTSLGIAAIVLTLASIVPAQAGWVNSPDEALAHRKWPAPTSQRLQWLPDNAWVSIQRCKNIVNNAPVPVVNGAIQKNRVWCRIKAGGVWGWAKGSFLLQ